jgi:hypothetical protein
MGAGGRGNRRVEERENSVWNEVIGKTTTEELRHNGQRTIYE